MSTDNNLPEELRGGGLSEEEKGQAEIDEQRLIDSQLTQLADTQAADGRVIDDLLEGPTTVLGMEIRPVTMATIAMLQATGNELIRGIPIDECENISLDCCRFVRLQTLPLKEATRLIKDPERFEDESYLIADKVPPLGMRAFIQQITAILTQSMETRTEPVADDEAKADEKVEALGED